ncbi:Transcriptional regulator, LysR family [Candidatus Rhodobacter oscarellae]|uniref:Transcriptional regulator, LysR family n=1 Tax=Candidatus Rhodobacter oscarellae TaxID=1675527 RepID=A0A0J9EBV9_9RHOB|nr:LysR substrate-binding domain-containing protein [Candidatus Rhodobacter lobularis]KMW60257.1 Transcriptional regulator, LysR family [Candidatus Rhodobacter lobularis]
MLRIMALNFRQYQAFYATIETGTVTGAAEALGISQPGISNLLAQLEGSTKLRLFERQRGRLVPTPEAEVLYREVETLVRGLDQVSQAVLDLQNQRVGQLQLAATHALAAGFLPNLIADFVADKPDLSISFQSQYSARIQEWVAAGLYEIGICEMPLLQDGLSHELYTFETFCALPQGSPLAKHEVLTPEILDGHPFIVLGADHMVTRRSAEAFHTSGATLKIRCQTDLFQNALNLVRQGVGATLVAPFARIDTDDMGYVLRPFRPKIMLDLMIVTAEGRPISALGQQFLSKIRAHLAEQ